MDHPGSTAVSPVVSDAALYLPLALVPGFDPRLSVGIAVLAVLSDRAFVFGLLPCCWAWG